jgi:hypothetical protein
MESKYAVSYDDEAVARLLKTRGYSPEFGEDQLTGRSQVLGIVHPEGEAEAFLFLRFAGHAKPADNGLTAYLVRAESSQDAVHEAGQIYLSIKDGFEYHKRLPLSPLHLASSWYPYLSEDEWKALEDRREVAGLTCSHWFEVFLAFGDSESLSRLAGFYPRPGGSTERLVTVVTDSRILEYFASRPADILSVTPREFEQLVAELLESLGYKDVRLCAPGRDGGVDVTAYFEHPIAIERVIVQCKRYSPPQKVGEPIIKQLLTDVDLKQASRGLIVTTSRLTLPARLLVESVRHRLSHIEGDELVRRLIQFRPPGPEPAPRPGGLRRR